MDLLIVGLTGQAASGKGEVAKLAKDLGYEVVILSDIIALEVRRRGLEVTRGNLQDVADDLRRRDGAGVLVEMAIEQASSAGVERLMIDGVRTVGEVKTLKKNRGKLMAVEIDLEVGLKRYLDRNRESDDASEEKYWALYERENSGVADDEMNIDRCIEMADVKISNDAEAEGLRRSSEGVLMSLEATARDKERE